MEYWVLKSDGGLIFNLDPCYTYKIRSHSNKPRIPSFHESISPGYSITAEPLNSDSRYAGSTTVPEDQVFTTGIKYLAFNNI